MNLHFDQQFGIITDDAGRAIAEFRDDSGLTQEEMRRVAALIVKREQWHKDDIITVRRALLNYIHLLDQRALEGQVDGRWSDNYVQEERERASGLLSHAPEFGSLYMNHVTAQRRAARG